ncbi:hypothetical protein Pelo_17350 [Pelomyxa schiedti]|nr:hypothetical protein Pelo_17350 [Pelomyxa schiedti]
MCFQFCPCLTTNLNCRTQTDIVNINGHGIYLFPSEFAFCPSASYREDNYIVDHPCPVESGLVHSFTARRLNFELEAPGPGSVQWISHWACYVAIDNTINWVYFQLRTNHCSVRDSKKVFFAISYSCSVFRFSKCICFIA